MVTSTSWRDIWTVAMGNPPSQDYLESALPAILLFYILAFSLCYLMYRLSSVFLPKLLQSVTHDFFKTMVFITFIFGNGLLRKHYGNLGYVLCTVPLNIVTCLLFSKGRDSVLGTIVSFTKGQINFIHFACHCIGQTVASFAAWKFGVLILELDFHDSFKDYHKIFTMSCDTDLRLPLVLGFLLELFGTAFSSWVFSQRFAKMEALDLGLKLLNCSLLVCFGYRLTGMYMNPTSATAFTLGCGDTPFLHHFLVYWAGPVLGVLLSQEVNKIYQISFGKNVKAGKKGKSLRTKKRKQA